MQVREDTGTYIIEEGDAETFGEYRFGLDRRERQSDGTVLRVNVGWYRTYRGAMNALSRAGEVALFSYAGTTPKASIAAPSAQSATSYTG